MADTEGLKNLEDYRISPTVGFLFEDPLERLPDYFEPWNYVGENIDVLIEKHQVREYVDKMPLLDHTRLEGEREWALAYTWLAAAGVGYINQDGPMEICRIVPRQLAVPWCHISHHMGIQSPFGYVPMVYANYAIIDKTKPLDYENLRNLSLMPEKSATSWLLRSAMMYEINSAPGIKAIVNGMNAALRDEEDQVTAALQIILQTFKNCKASFTRIHEGLTPQQFVRPMILMGGWGGPGSIYEDGVIMEGVSEEPIQNPPSNVSLACPAQCFDSALGVEHNEMDRKCFEEKRLLWLPSHRQFIQDIQKCPSFKQYVQSKNNEVLTELLSKCLAAVREFRSYHIQIFTKYQLSALQENDDRLGLTGDERISKVLMKRLKDLRNETTMTKPA